MVSRDDSALRQNRGGKVRIEAGAEHGKRRLGTREGLPGEIVEALVHRIGKDEQAALPHDWLAATIYTLRDEIIERWMDSSRAAHAAGSKRVYYLSMEFLIGRLLRDTLSNLGRSGEVREALESLGVDLSEIEEIEPDAALGNGGLGRLAACFMESLASLDIPAYGYGIRYVNGMFRQRIDDGWQVELPENWARPRQSLGVRAPRERLSRRFRRRGRRRQ